MSNMNFNCDVCGREVQGCTLVNGMKFCAKCYQETFGETDKDKQIAELQKQLKEKEKKIEDLKESKQYFIMNYNHIIDKLQKQLESQPAEIVEKIKNYKGEYFEWKIGDKIYPAFKITEEDLDNILI